MIANQLITVRIRELERVRRAYLYQSIRECTVAHIIQTYHAARRISASFQTVARALDRAVGKFCVCGAGACVSVLTVAGGRRRCLSVPCAPCAKWTISVAPLCRSVVWAAARARLLYPYLHAAGLDQV